MNQENSRTNYKHMDQEHLCISYSSPHVELILFYNLETELSREEFEPLCLLAVINGLPQSSDTWRAPNSIPSCLCVAACRWVNNLRDAVQVGQGVLFWPSQLTRLSLHQLSWHSVLERLPLLNGSLLTESPIACFSWKDQEGCQFGAYAIVFL